MKELKKILKMSRCFYSLFCFLLLLLASSCAVDEFDEIAIADETSKMVEGPVEDPEIIIREKPNDPSKTECGINITISSTSPGECFKGYSAWHDIAGDVKYKWVVISGDIEIVGADNQQHVLVEFLTNQGGIGEIKALVTGNNVCSENLIVYGCKDGTPPPYECHRLGIDGTNVALEGTDTAQASLSGIGYNNPCIEDVDITFKLGPHIKSYTNLQGPFYTTLAWNIPSGNWTGHLLNVQFKVKYTDGITKVLTRQMPL